MIEVETLSVGPMEIDIDPRLQEDEPIARHVEGLIEMQVDPNELSWVIKIGKSLENELAKQLTELLKKNLDMLAWKHTDMVGIHPEIMCHRLNIEPSNETSTPKVKSIRCRLLSGLTGRGRSPL